MCRKPLTPLLHGVEKSTKPEHNLRQVEDFISRLEVLDYDIKAAAHYGNIRADLEGKGTIIGINDLHIAGHARSAGLILVTNNLRVFDRVDGLRLDNWIWCKDKENGKENLELSILQDFMFELTKRKNSKIGGANLAPQVCHRFWYDQEIIGHWE